MTSATVSLVLIGLLAIAITPNRSPTPIAASSTVRAISAASATPAAIASSSAVTTVTALPIVTPIGDEGWAVTTAEAVAGATGSMQARLPSGDVVDIEVVGSDPDAGLVVVTLPASADTRGYQLASDRPGPSDTVFVNAPEPTVVTMIDLASLDVEEGTPVLDDAGALVGLCTGDHDGTALMTVDTLPGTDTTVDPGTGSTTNVETTQPATTDDITTIDSTSPDSTNPESTVADSTTVDTTTPDTEVSTTTETTEVNSTGVISTPER